MCVHVGSHPPYQDTEYCQLPRSFSCSPSPSVSPRSKHYFDLYHHRLVFLALEFYKNVVTSSFAQYYVIDLRSFSLFFLTF